MIVEWRKKRKLTQEELAKISGVPQGVISYIESGRTKSPRIDTLKAIADALGCKIEDLIATEKTG